MNIPEHFPTITVDAALGRHVDYVDVDLEYIAGRLADGKLSPEEIDDLTISFSSRDNLEPSRIDRQVTRGGYIGLSNTIHIARPRGFDSDVLIDDESRQVDAAEASLRVSKTLDHELEHVLAVGDDELAQERAKYNRVRRVKVLARSSLLWSGVVVGAGFWAEMNAGIEDATATALFVSIGLTAVKNFVLDDVVADLRYAEYSNDPEEQRAKAAEETAPADLVSFVPKGYSISS